jgi:hypothetical protein
VKGTTVTCSPLYNSIRTLRAAATKVNSEQKVLSLENCCSSYAELTVYHTAFCALMTKRHEHFQELQKQLLSKQLNKDSLKIRQLNDRLMQTERAFTSREGIFKLEWFKHLVSRYSCAKHSPSSLEIAQGLYTRLIVILTVSVPIHRCMDLQIRMTGILQSILV